MNIDPATDFRLSRISNRHFIVRLKTLLTHTKQTPENVSNRNISDPPAKIRPDFPLLPPPPSYPHLIGTFSPRGENM